MDSLFLKVLNLGITTGWMILAVILVRCLIKKAPKWICCMLWSLVALRMICPFSLKSVFSLIPSSETVPENIITMDKPVIDSGITIINDLVNPVITENFAAEPAASADPMQIIIHVMSLVWIAGMIVMALYAFVSYWKTKHDVRASIFVKDNVFACDEVISPFILGILRPRIYVPSSMDDETLSFVNLHERSHIQRRDHWWKPFGFLLLTVYWFNPLCWIAYTLLCRDIELACDEKVIKTLDNSGKAAYSQAILNCSFPRHKISACPLAFGEVGVKKRVKSVLNYRKPAFWIIFLSILASVAVALCFMTDPKESTFVFRYFEGKEDQLPAYFTDILSVWGREKTEVFDNLNLDDPLASDELDSLYYLYGSAPKGNIYDMNNASGDGNIVYANLGWTLKLRFSPVEDHLLTDFEYETLCDDAASAQAAMDLMEQSLITVLGDPVGANEDSADPDDYAKAEDRVEAIVGLDPMRRLVNHWHYSPEDSAENVTFTITAEVMRRDAVSEGEPMYTLHLRVSANKAEVPLS